MNWKNRTWLYATGLVVALIVLIPEMTHLALFIDAVGLEMFMLMLELQLVAIFVALLSFIGRPALLIIKRSMVRQLLERNLKTVFSNKEYLVMAAPGPAMVMHALVFLAAIEIVHNAL